MTPSSKILFIRDWWPVYRKEARYGSNFRTRRILLNYFASQGVVVVDPELDEHDRLKAERQRRKVGRAW